MTVALNSGYSSFENMRREVEMLKDQHEREKADLLAKFDRQIANLKASDRGCEG